MAHFRIVTRLGLHETVEARIMEVEGGMVVLKGGEVLNTVAAYASPDSVKRLDDE